MRPPQVVTRWGVVLARTGRAMYEDDCLGWAGELAFFWFLALFPALLFVVALAGSFPVQHLIDAVWKPCSRWRPAMCSSSSGTSSSRSGSDHPAVCW